MLVLTVTRLFFLFHITSNSFEATSISANLRPNNGSLVALLPGETNFLFECDIFLKNDVSGELVQITTAWTLQNYGSSGDVRTLIFQTAFEGVFLIQGTPQPSGSVSGTFRNRLLLLNFTEELDRTILRCRSQSGKIEKPGSFWLRIYRVPQLMQGQTVTVLEGASIEINVSDSMEAFPFPREYQWTRNGVVLHNTSAAVFGYPAISFLNVSRSDSDQYVLTATNYRLDYPAQKLGTGVGSVHVNVLYGPDLVRGPSVATGALGASVKLTCGTNLVSNPEPIISWSDNQGNTVMLSGNRFSQDDDPSLLSLTVAELEMVDAGIWICNIEVASVGMVRHHIHLTVLGPPSSPRNVEVTSSGATSIHFSWMEPIILGTPSFADTIYSITAISQNDMTTISTQLLDMTSGTIDGLLPSTQYSFTVTAWSSSGGAQVAGDPSSPIFHITVTTVPDIECNSTPLSSNGIIIISWSFVHTGGLNLTQVTVSSSTDTFMVWDFQPLPSTPTLVDEEGRPTSLTVSKLPAGNTYVFTVRAFNMLGNSSVSCPPITHDIGIPQAPNITGARSSNGQVILEVMTRESGTLPLNFFQFIIRVEHARMLRNVKLTLAEYVDGEKVELVVEVFERPEEVADAYIFVVSCTNAFGISGESDPFAVTVQFTSPLSATMVGGIATAVGVLVMLVAVLVAMYCVYLQRRHNKKKRTINPVNILARPSPCDITGSIFGVPESPAMPFATPLSLHLVEKPCQYPPLSPNINPLPSPKNMYIHGDYFLESLETDGVYDKLPSIVDVTSSSGRILSRSCIALSPKRVGDTDSSIRKYAESPSSQLPPKCQVLLTDFDPDTVVSDDSQLQSNSINREILALEKSLSGAISEIISRDKATMEEDYDTLNSQNLYRQNSLYSHSLRTLC